METSFELEITYLASLESFPDMQKKMQNKMLYQLIKCIDLLLLDWNGWIIGNNQEDLQLKMFEKKHGLSKVESDC